MHKPYPRFITLIHLLIISALFIQPIAIPLDALASALPSSASLTRGAHEELDSYLQRVAAAQPELFQRAAMAAVQDAFNGSLPEVSGDHAMEEQIAHYIELAATGAVPASASPSNTTSSTIEGDTYRWNSSRTDESGKAGSAWEMTARPGGDTQLFAQNFEALMASEVLPLGIPAQSAIEPGGQSEATEINKQVAPIDAGMKPISGLDLFAPLSVVPASAPVANEIAAATIQNQIPIETGPLAPGPLARVDVESALAAKNGFNFAIQKIKNSAHQQQADPQQLELKQHHFSNQEKAANSNQFAAINHTLFTNRSLFTNQTNRYEFAAPAVQQVVQAVEADLAVTVTAPVTATFGEIITYTFTVTNHGPNPASAVQLTQTLPSNGVYTHTVAGCLGSGEQVVCNIGAVTVNASKTLTVAVQMKGDGAVTSTVNVADSGGTTDPGGQPATASASTEVSSTNRTQREVGKVVIEAEEFKTVAGQVEASGAVEIGYKKPDNSFVFHLKLGADDSLTWTDGMKVIEGEGTLSYKVNNIELFNGKFGIDASKDDPLIIPSEPTNSDLKDLAGFAIVGKSVISQVQVISGTTLLSATIKFNLPGISDVSPITSTGQVSGTGQVTDTNAVSDTTEFLVASIYPDGKIEGEIKKFEMIFSGLKIEVGKAKLSQDEISVKIAKLTMPEKFGKLTGVIQEMKVTTNSINFGGVGVKIPIPDIYPVGAPVTSTTAVTTTGGLTATGSTTPTVAIVKNAATVGIVKGKFVLQVEGTLQLWLPGNQRNIPIEFKIDSDGDLEGTVKEIELTIAGQDLSMKDVTINNSGLKVAEAQLTIKGSADDKDKANKTSAAGTISNTLSAAQATSDSPKSKDSKNTKITVIVKNVEIDKNGISIGGVGATNYLPDIKIGDAAAFKKLEFTVEVNHPITDASLELAIKGVLEIYIAQGITDTQSISGTPGVTNTHKVEFSAKMDKDGKFSGKIKALTLTIAKSKLEIKDMAFDQKGFAAKEATLTLPESLGSVKATITLVKIDEKGLSFGDASVAIPIKFTIGSKDENGNKIAVDGNLTLILAKDRTYGFGIEGTVTLVVAKQTAEATGSFRMDSSGEMRGSIDSFKLVIAGMELAIKSATVKDGVVEAGEATLSIPKEWGGLSVSVYQIKISSDGFSIGGGKFKLPEIKVGDMLLTLEGELKKEGDGYIIAAGGKLKMPNLGGAGCSGLGVSVEIFAGTSQQVVMRIAPAEAASADAVSIQLRKVGVSLECTIPLGASGFDLTSVSGTLTLSNNSTKIEIKVTLESKLRVGPVNAMTANGDMSMEYVKDPYKFEIGLGASMKLFSLFEAARARATMRFADGPVPFLFKAEMNIDAVIAKGEIKLSAWTKDGSFYLTGRIYGQVGVRRGALVNSCWNMPVPGVRWISKWWGGYPEPYIEYKNVCLTLPPSDLFISALMEFGKFQRDGGDAWGFKAAVNLLGKNYGIYVDSSGNFSVGNTDQYRLVDTPSLERARYLQQMIAAGVMAANTLSAEDMDLVTAYEFAENGEITVHVTNLSKPGDLGITVMRSVEDADVIITLVRPDGLQIASSNAPGNVTFREENLTYSDQNDPTTNELIQLKPTIQSLMNVTNAPLGNWYIKMSRQPTYGFIVNADGTVYGPPVEKLAVTNQNDTDNQVNLSWTQSTALSSTVSIYATQDTITTTASYTETQSLTDANGVAASQVLTVDLGTVTQFGGYPVASFNYLPGKQTLNKQVDLSFLRSGSYSLWLEVEDGINPPTRQYFPGKVTVWHPWAESWQAKVTATPNLGGLTVAWHENGNPDVDGYEVQVSAAGDTTDEDTFFLDVGQTLSQTLTGLSANQAYSVTIVAYDTGSGRESFSERIQATPLPAPFAFVASPSTLTVQGGGSANATLTIASTVNPYPDRVYLDIDSIPEGIDVTLTSDIVTPTLAGVQTKVLVTPAATLPGGVYTLTLSASSNSDVKQVQIPITVQEPSFSLQANRNALSLNQGGSTSLDISALYQFGEKDEINVELDEIPAGIDWSFTQSSFLPGQKATLLLTDTAYLAHGTYTVTVSGSDHERTQSLSLPLTVSGFEISTNWDSWAAANGATVTYTLALTGAAWPDAVTFSFDPASLAGHFAAVLPSPNANVPASRAALVTVLPDTPPGVYELLLNATSRGISKTLPLYVTVQDDPDATDLQIGYASASLDLLDGFIVAGETYSYTLKPRNISTNPALDVAAIDLTIGSDVLTLVDDGDCTVQENGDETELTCAMGDIPTGTEAVGPTISWQVDADAPDGLEVVHETEVFAQAAMYSETSDLDNLAALELNVLRLSDLRIEAEADGAIAGALQTFTTTVTNEGPSDADETLVDIYFPAEVSLMSASPECADDVEVMTCLLDTLAPGESAVVTTTVLIVPDAQFELETLVVASSESDDPDFSNNYLFIYSDVAAVANLTVSVMPKQSNANEGEIVDFVVAVTNYGPSQATDVGIDLLLPDYADIVDLQIGGVTETPDHLDIAAGDTLTLTVSTLFLEDSQHDPVEIEVDVDAEEAPAVHATNQSLTVHNVNPTVVLSSTLTANEGELNILTVHVDDAGTIYDPLSIQWDLDNDGAFDDGNSAIVLFDARTIDGPATRPIAVRVTDDDGGQTTVTGVVVVKNVAPTIDAGIDLTRQVNQAVSINFAFSDPFAGDKQNVVVDWGDGKIETVPVLVEASSAEASLGQASHTYSQIGNFTANICMKDDDQGQGCDKVLVQSTCREHGMIAHVDSVGSQVVIRLDNTSGTVTIPAGLKLTLYRGQSVLKTFTLDKELAVGATQTLNFTQSEPVPDTYTLRMVVDDDGSGTKQTQLCSGSVERSVVVVTGTFVMFLPVIRR